MSNIFFCKMCVYPSSKPHIEFNEDGICSGCIAFNNRSKIDWEKRETRLKKILNKYKQQSPNYYHCIVPSSGGKDSHYQTIKMLEFFNYSCGHCYRFLETSKTLRTKFKDKLHHKKYPIYWGNQTAYPSMAFYITDDLGLEEEFTQELFDTNFKLNINIFQPKVIRFLANEFKI